MVSLVVSIASEVTSCSWPVRATVVCTAGIWLTTPQLKPHAITRRLSAHMWRVTSAAGSLDVRRMEQPVGNARLREVGEKLAHKYPGYHDMGLALPEAVSLTTPPLHSCFRQRSKLLCSAAHHLQEHCVRRNTMKAAKRDTRIANCIELCSAVVSKKQRGSCLSFVRLKSRELVRWSPDLIASFGTQFRAFTTPLDFQHVNRHTYQYDPAYG